MKIASTEITLPSAAHRRIKVGIVTAVGITVRYFLIEIMRALQKAGYEVVVFCSEDNDSRYVASLGFEVVYVSILRRVSPIGDLRALLTLRKLFRQHRVDIVHTHTPKGAFLGQLAARSAGVKVRFTTVHGFYFVNQRRLLPRMIYKKLETYACRIATDVFCVSQEDIDYLSANGYLPAEKMQWMTVGVDLTRFNPETLGQQRAVVRQENDIPPGAFVIGIVARMVYEKGFAELFEAFASLREVAPEAYLVHVGPVDASRGDEVTPKLAEQWHITPYCRFLGLRQDVPRQLTGMDVFCLPSHREGYPTSVMEASAMGLPSIVSDIRGCREAVVHEQTGLVVPVQAPLSLAAAMKKLHDDLDFRLRLGFAARQKAVTQFDREHMIEKTLQAYAKALDCIDL